MEDISANIYKNIKHLTRLPLALSHLSNHKFKYSFLNSLNSICICSLDTETTSRFILHYPNFINDRTLLLSNASRLPKINYLPVTRDTIFIFLFIYTISILLLYGDDSLDSVTNTLILNSFVGFILLSKISDGRLL